MTTAAGADLPVGLVAPARPQRRRRLFRKYVTLFVAVVSTALLASGVLEIWFGYREQIASLVRMQRGQAEAAADKIADFITGIQNQIGWTTQLPWIPEFADQQRLDALRLLRQVPAITELSQLNGEGREQLRVSRITMEVIGSQADFSADPRFADAIARGAYFGPVYFRLGSEPYMTIAQMGPRRENGVSVAELNLKFIWDLVSRIEVGNTGVAYVVDATGRLVAHPDITMVLRNTDLSGLPQVAAVLAGQAADRAAGAHDVRGQRVVTAHSAIPRLGWLVFVELPLREALVPIFVSMARTGGLLLLGLGVAFLAGLVLARRMLAPIDALRAGAARIGSGDLDRPLEMKTGDELEELVASFNDMAAKLKTSYRELEQRVAQRTEELARSVAELTALGEVTRAVNSTLDLETVLTTIVAKAVELSGADAGGIHEFDPVAGIFRLTASHGSAPELNAEINRLRISAGETVIGEATARRAPAQIPDLAATPPSAVRDILERGGYRAVLAVPLLRGAEIVGALVVRRSRSGAFAEATVDLLRTFAAQSVLAIQNARLFGELAEKGRQLELASAHKSQFLANMSHELRTPLNAILGYTELIIDSVYGEVSPRLSQVLDRVQINGKHLLALINDVLDLARIEAGQSLLAVDRYDLGSVITSVIAGLEALARGKGLELRAEVATGLPSGRGDERRLAQVIVNLVSNAIKFTETGSVVVAAGGSGDRFEIEVRDTGIGIAAADQARIFAEFQQVDASSTRSRGGSGLGLAITQRIVAMHGGTISVESALGKGSTFRVSLPVQVSQMAEVA